MEETDLSQYYSVREINARYWKRGPVYQVTYAVDLEPFSLELPELEVLSLLKAILRHALAFIIGQAPPGSVPPFSSPLSICSAF